ncbi:MAG: hypothetical protein E7553_04485 [Ruminococcaceae bacterium]|nr:hypothetical protein [Oscillospiraceae bacterium]
MATFLKRLMFLVGGLMLLFYIGYHIFMNAYSPIKTDVAILYDEYETVDTTGFVVRNETLIPMTQQGFVYYIAENGSRVSKDGKIADLYIDQEAAVAKQQLQAVDAEIAQLKTIEEQGQNNRTNLDIINTQLYKAQAAVIAEMSQPHLSQIDTLSTNLLTLMNKQQITIGRAQSFEARLSALSSQRAALAAKNAAPTSSVFSPTAGYFVNTVDGLEAAIDADSVISVTTDEIRQAMQTEPTVDNSRYIGKVVGSYEWYLVCVLPAEEITRLPMDGMVRLRLPFVSNETIPVTVVAENRDRDGNMAVVFRCDYMSADLSDIRLEQVQVLVKQHSGLRVPDEAVRFNEAQEAGVFVQEGNVIRFRRIRVAYHSEHEDYSICEVVNENGYLQVYDDIVVEGKNLYDGKIVR